MNFYNISHNTYPVAVLVYGHVAENMETARQVGWQIASRFEPDGTLIYRPEPGKPDYGRTHYAPDASGYTAAVVQDESPSASPRGYRVATISW